jgi:hypothetical protein
MPAALTRGWQGSNTTSAISLALRAWGASSFLPPVSLPTFQLILVILQAERPHRTKPMGL